MSSFHSKYAAKALKEIEKKERLKEEQHKRVEDQHSTMLFLCGVLASPLAIYMVVSVINCFFH